MRMLTDRVPTRPLMPSLRIASLLALAGCGVDPQPHRVTEYYADNGALSSADATAKPGAPTVAFAFPQPSSVLIAGRPQSVLFSGSEAERRPLTYRIEVSPDAGTT